MNYAQMTELELDALKEVGNIGAAHAATALSQIVERTILINVTRVNIIPVEAIAHLVGGPQGKVAAVHLKILGDVLGGMAFLLEWENALALSEILSKRPQGSLQEFSELEASGLKEAGSILSAAYLRAIGELMRMPLIPTVPSLLCGEVQSVLEKILKELKKRAETAFCIETEFVEASHRITGHFLLIPEVKVLRLMLQALGIGGKP